MTEPTPCTMDLGGGLTLTVISVEPMDNNVYLLSDAQGAVLIDAANDAPRIADLIAGHQVATIITTHRHHDHVQALAEIAAATGADLVCGEPDAEAIEAQTGVRPRGLWTGDTVALPGGGALEVIGLVGHTPGSIALAWAPADGPAHLFTGDSLFPGGVGKTHSPADFTSLLDDVETRLFGAYADDTTVWPGHGQPTTLGAERPQLGQWRERGW